MMMMEYAEAKKRKKREKEGEKRGKRRKIREGGEEREIWVRREAAGIYKRER